MSEIRAVCVYCGTQQGLHPAYVAAADHLGRELARRGIAIIYGGASIGVMGALARGGLDAGGRVTGIIPEFLTERESALEDVSDLIITSSMQA